MNSHQPERLTIYVLKYRFPDTWLSKHAHSRHNCMLLHTCFLGFYLKKKCVLFMLAKFYCSNKLTLDSQWLNKIRIYSKFVMLFRAGCQGLSLQLCREPGKETPWSGDLGLHHGLLVAAGRGEKSENQASACELLRPEVT